MGGAKQGGVWLPVGGVRARLARTTCAFPCPPLRRECRNTGLLWACARCPSASVWPLSPTRAPGAGQGPAKAEKRVHGVFFPLFF